MSFPVVLKLGPAHNSKIFANKLNDLIQISTMNGFIINNYHYHLTDNYEIIDDVICVVYVCKSVSI